MLHNRIGTLLHFKIIIRTPRLTSAGMSTQEAMASAR
jgi:hypothetical protein